MYIHIEITPEKTCQIYKAFDHHSMHIYLDHQKHVKFINIKSISSNVHIYKV